MAKWVENWLGDDSYNGKTAASFIRISAPAVNETSLTAPSVPSGYTIGIVYSSNEEVIGSTTINRNRCQSRISGNQNI